MKRTVLILCAAAILVATGILFSASSLQAPSGSWIVVGPMNSARSSASTVLLQDGRLLVTGGDDANGPSNVAEFFGANGSFSLGAPMNVPRSGHVSVAFQDGRILVAGGITSGGSASSTAEIFDPTANSWTNIALGMTEARSGATAGLLPDGRVVVAGGQNGTLISSTIEVFDPSLGAFAFAGTMSSPRTQHAMAVLTDGRVLIVGGNNGTAPVGSTDIFDPVAGTVSAGPSLSVARFGHSATALLNGLVVVIGGNNGNSNAAQMDVTPAELFDPAAATPAFTTLASALATPREGHHAFLLPNNNNVLIVGGTSGGAAVASAELLTPQESPQGVWTYAFGSTGSMTTARSNTTGAPNQVSTPSSVTQRNGVLLIAGGKDANGNALNSAEAYGFPTVQTDAGDYPPGTTVNIAGSGWKPGETVTIQLVESPLIDTHGPYSVTADANGNISDSSFVTDIHDIDVRFYLTVAGQASGFLAQTTFTDATNASNGDGTMVVSPTNVTAGSAGNTLTFTFTSPNGGNFNAGSQATILVPAGWTAPTSGNVSVAPGPSPNCTAVALGTITGTGPWTIPINMTCPAKDQFSLTFSGVTAPGTSGANTFTTKTKQSGGVLTSTGSSPVVNVNQAPTFTSANSTTFTVGTVGSFSVTTTGGSPTPTLSESGSFPSGVTFTDNGNGTATLGGTPMVAGTFNLTFTAANSAGSLTQNFTLLVNKGTPAFNNLSVSQVISYGTPSISVSGRLNAGSGIVPSGTATITIDSAPVATSSSFAGQAGNFSATVNTSSIAATATAYTITYSYAGDNNFNSTTDTSTTLTVNKATLTASIIGNPTKPYDGNTSATLTSANFSISGLLGTDSFTVTQTAGTYNSANVATAATVTASLTSGNFMPVGTTMTSNYALPTAASGAGHITAVTLTASIIGDPTKPYNGNTSATLTSTNFSLATLVSGESITVTQTSGTYNSANVVGATTVTASLTSGNFTAGAGTLLTNYMLPTTASGPGQITAVTLTASIIGDPTKPYNGNTSATLTSANFSLATLVSGESITVTQTSGTYNSANVVGATTVTASLTSGNFTAGAGTLLTNYMLPTTASGPGQITAVTLTASIIGDPTKPYNGNTSATLTSTNFSLATLVSGESITVTQTSGTYNSANVVGATTVTASLTSGNFTAGAGTLLTNYMLPTTASGPGQITAVTLTASIIGDPTKPYNGNTSATLTSTNFSLATLVSGESITVTQTSGTYNSANVVGATTVTASLTSGNFTAGAGTLLTNYMLPTTASGPGQITAVTLTASIIGDPTKPYNGNTSATLTSTNFSLATLVSGESITVTQTSGTYNSANVVGATTVTASLTSGNFTAGAGTLLTNYMLPTTASGPGQINARPATWTTNPNSKTYGDSDPNPLTTGSGTNFVAADGVTASYIRAAGETVLGGPYQISATLSPAAVLSNYIITNAGANFTINARAATWTTTPASKTYGDPDPNPLTTGSGTNFVAADGVTASYSRAAGETVLGGPYQISATLSPAAVLSNYIITNAGANFTINARAATWTTTPASKTYGDPDPNPLTTGNGTNFVAADNVTASYSRAAGETVTGGPYQITATLSPAVVLSNYIITDTGANFTINARLATWTTNPNSKTYGDADPNPLTTGSGTNFVAADGITASYSRAAGETVTGGPYQISATLSPAGVLSNYIITNTGASFTINARLATWTTNPNSKTYGDADPNPLTTGSGTNFVAADGVTASYSRAAGETVTGGPYQISATLSPAGVLSNYIIINTGASFTINARLATWTTNPNSKTYGDADPNPLTTGSGTNFVAADGITASYSRADGETVTGGPYQISTTLSPAGVLSNYIITNAGANFTINTRSATWTTYANSKTYGNPDPNPLATGSGTNFVATDGVTASYSRAAGETVLGGPYHITATLAPIAVLSNYSITNTGASFTINPAPLMITASSPTMIYGGPVPPITPSYNVFVNGDTMASLTAQPICVTSATSLSPVSGNPYASICSGAADSNYSIGYSAGIVTVMPATTTTAVTSSVNPSTFMQLVTFTATVSPQFGGTTPTGTVTFYNNGSMIGTGTLSIALCIPGPCPDQATFSISSLPDSGLDNITAWYSGDSNFITSTSPAITQTVQPAPNVSLTPLSVSFGNQNVNTKSNPATVTLSNIGDAALNISVNGISIIQSSTDFAQTNNCGSTLAASKSCMITVTFTPVDTGIRTASLQITDNDDDASNAQQIVSLTGSGLSTISGSSLYTDAIFATANGCGSITGSGNGSVDSFNSSVPGGYTTSHVLSGGNVGTNGNVTLSGNSTIYGWAAVDSMTTGNCSKTSYPGLTTNGGAQVKGGMVALNGPITYPAPPAPNPAPPTTTENISGSCGSISGCTNTGSKTVSLVPGQYGNLSLSGGTTAHFSTGTYNINSLTLSGQSILYMDSGPVVVNLAGASLSGGNPVLDATGGSIQNPSGIPANLQITYAGSRGVNLSGGAGSFATVYAPNALVNMSGNSDFFGSIIASTLTNSGNAVIHYDTSLPSIQAGNFIWFDAVVNNVAGLPSSGQVKLYLTNSTITFTAKGTSYTVPVPNAVVTFNSSTALGTTFSTTNNRWSTSVPKSSLTGNTFVSGVAFPVPAGGFPSGIQNVKWSASFSTDTQGVTLQWQWGAAVYTSFNNCYAFQNSNSSNTCYNTTSNSNMLGVNAEDGSADAYGTDLAGTPENYKASVIFGATGGGLTNYTGYFSSGAGVVPTVAPMSVSPSSLDFGPQNQETTSASMMTVLTNNDSAPHAISSISITGTNASDFTSTNTCPISPPAPAPPYTLAGGASCTITVTFMPSDVGTRTARIVVNDDANNSPQTVYLSGTGQ